MKCQLDNCIRPVSCKSLCKRHYERKRRGLYFEPTPPIYRFMNKVEFLDSGCWDWKACKTKDGYGHFRFNGGTRIAHRWSYEYFVSAIPDGLTLDHLCRRRSCVNPDHLEPVSQSVNALRSEMNIANINAKKTACPRGHLYSAENTYIAPRPNGRTARVCRECKSDWIKNRKPRKHD